MADETQAMAHPLVMDSSRPEQMPEVHREITMLVGATDSLQRMVNEICERIEPVLRRVEPEAEKANALATPQLQVTTSIGERIHQVWDDLGALERRIGYTINRLEI